MFVCVCVYVKSGTTPDGEKRSPRGDRSEFIASNAFNGSTACPVLSFVAWRSLWSMGRMRAFRRTYTGSSVKGGLEFETPGLVGGSLALVHRRNGGLFGRAPAVVVLQQGSPITPVGPRLFVSASTATAKQRVSFFPLEKRNLLASAAVAGSVAVVLFVGGRCNPFVVGLLLGIFLAHTLRVAGVQGRPGTALFSLLLLLLL